MEWLMRCNATLTQACCGRCHCACVMLALVLAALLGEVARETRIQNLPSLGTAPSGQCRCTFACSKKRFSGKSRAMSPFTNE